MGDRTRSMKGRNKLGSSVTTISATTAAPTRLAAIAVSDIHQDSNGRQHPATKNNAFAVLESSRSWAAGEVETTITDATSISVTNTTNGFSTPQLALTRQETNSKATTTAIVIEEERNQPTEASGPTTMIAKVAHSPADSSRASSCSSAIVCRICHCDHGKMVSPCRCAGSLGVVHAVCLNEWIAKSGRGRRCEICHAAYFVTGSRLAPIAQWNRPQPAFGDLLRLGLLALLLFSAYYTISLLVERQTFSRLNDVQASIGRDDYVRCAVTVLVLVFLLIIFVEMVWRCVRFANRQRVTTFGNTQQRPPAPPTEH